MTGSWQIPSKSNISCASSLHAPAPHFQHKLGLLDPTLALINSGAPLYQQMPMQSKFRDIRSGRGYITFRYGLLPDFRSAHSDLFHTLDT